jgi:dCMP deaminase
VTTTTTRARQTWDETWLRVAEAVARRSLCVRAEVGAVVVGPGNRVVATGYNGPPAGFPHGERACDAFCVRGACGPRGAKTDYGDCVSLHAEANALLACGRGARVDGTIYLTKSACWECAKLVASSGLARVVTRGPARTVSHDFMRECGLEVATI